jgi:hypothetical protein
MQSWKNIMCATKTKGVKNMKKYNLITCVLSIAFVGLILIGCETTQSGAASAPPNSGHVLIYRVANFGDRLSLVVSVDGKDVGSFTEGRNYSGYLPAGQHTLMARVSPNPGGKRPTHTKTVNVQAGQTYVYTAAWSGGKLVLVQGH